MEVHSCTRQAFLLCFDPEEPNFTTGLMVDTSFTFV